jgi:hypothetical protein
MAPGGTDTKRITEGTYPVISGDGRVLAFYGAEGIVYYHVPTETRTQVGPVPLFAGTGMDLSKDGRYLAFATDAPLINYDTNGASDVYLYDHLSPIMAPMTYYEPLSQEQGGPMGDAASAWGFPLEHLATISLTGDARFAAFETWASNLGGPGVVIAGTGVLYLLDTDLDGCTDKLEVGPRPEMGGGRNPNNFWDFFDTPPRDKAVTVKEIGNIVRRYGSMGDPDIDPLSDPPPAPEYHTGFDRTVAPNQLTGPPNGSITISDIMLAVLQFGHTCVPVSTMPTDP